ncbi:hypothetical protein SPFM12_00302 [Salmonella phage SPFM12]|nr:hypothetical protein SPFM12_00302 [Salmonella phage SPFM12]
MNYKHYKTLGTLFDSMCAAVMQKRLPYEEVFACLSRSESSAINEMPQLMPSLAVDVVAIYTGSDTPTINTSEEVFPVLMQLPQFQPWLDSLDENKLPTTLRPQCSYSRMLASEVTMITQCYYQTQDLFKALEELRFPLFFFFFHDCLRIL